MEGVKKMTLDDLLKRRGIEYEIVEINPPMAFGWFRKQVGKLEICPKCEKWWLVARSDMCLSCFITHLNEWHERSRHSKLMVR
jgi:hypothetical protein